MNNKTNIEEDIKTLESMLEEYKNCSVPEIDMQVDVTFRRRQAEAIENILADREEWKNKAEWFKRCCNKNFDTAQQLQAKANAYDSLVEKIKKKIKEYERRKEDCRDVETKIRLDVKIQSYKELLDTKQ